jgi:hypothetical protein
MMRNLIITFVLCATTLVGCGGGGGSSSSTSSGSSNSTPGQAQGVYQGTSSTGFTFESIVLPDDTVYALYGTISGSTLFISGLVTGQGASRNGTFSATLTDFFQSNTGIPATMNASYVVGTSFSGSLTESGQNISFTGTPLASTTYTYNRAAATSEIVGTWNGRMLDGTAATITINANGSLTGTNAGCSFSGTLSPDTSGKNFFRLSVTFANSGFCLLPGQTGSGIAVDYLVTGTSLRQILIGGTASGRGTVFAATH